MTIFIAILFGIAAFLALWAGRARMVQKFNDDVAWVGATSMRFNPEPIDARQRTIILYGLYALELVIFIVYAPNAAFAILLWFVTLWIPRLVADWAWKRRRKQIDKQLAPAIAAMSNSMRAGLTLVQAIQRLGEQAPDPIRTEFKVMANRYAYGADLATTVREAKDRLQLPNFNLFATAVLLNREMGGDVSETLTRISKSLDRLTEMRQTVEAHTSEGRMNIKVLLVAPFVMLAMLSTVDSQGIVMLFSTTEGYGILFAAAVLTGAGVFFAGKITRSEV